MVFTQRPKAVSHIKHDDSVWEEDYYLPPVLPLLHRLHHHNRLPVDLVSLHFRDVTALGVRRLLFHSSISYCGILSGMQGAVATHSSHWVKAGFTLNISLVCHMGHIWTSNHLHSHSLVDPGAPKVFSNGSECTIFLVPSQQTPILLLNTDAGNKLVF